MVLEEGQNIEQELEQGLKLRPQSKSSIQDDLNQKKIESIESYYQRHGHQPRVLLSRQTDKSSFSALPHENFVVIKSRKTPDSSDSIQNK